MKQSLLIMALRSSTLGAKFLLTLFIARFLNLESLGAYGLITGFTVVAPVVIGMGLQNTLAREAVGQPLPALTHNLRHYWSLILALYTLLGLAAAAWGIATGHTELALAIAAITALEHLNQDTFVILINRHRALLGNVLMFIRAAGWIFLYIAAAFLIPALRTLEWLLIFWLTGIILPLILFARDTRHWPWLITLKSPLNSEWFKTHLTKARFLFMSDVAYAASQYTDRYLITFFLGLETAGVYVFFWQIGNAVQNLVSTAINQLYRPKLILAFKQKDEEKYWALFRQNIKFTAANAVVLSLIVGICVAVCLPYLNKPLLAANIGLLVGILIGVTVRLITEVLTSILFSQHRDKQNAIALILTLTLNTLLNISLINVMGAYGSMLAIIASNVTIFGIRLKMITKGGF